MIELYVVIYTFTLHLTRILMTNLRILHTDGIFLSVLFWLRREYSNMWHLHERLGDISCLLYTYFPHLLPLSPLFRYSMVLGFGVLSFSCLLSGWFINSALV